MPSGPRCAELTSPAQAEATPVLYGGSVTSASIGEFLDEAAIDGALVGGASLKAGRDGRHRGPRRHHRRRPRCRLATRSCRRHAAPVRRQPPAPFERGIHL